jgi:hypothetical protein
MNTTLELMLKLTLAIAVAAVVLLLVGHAAFLETRPPASPPSAAPIAARSLGPTVQQLEAMGQLTSMRVVVTDVLSAEGDGYRGVWLIKGDVLLACDMSKAAVVARDDERRKATIRLPRPHAVSPRVDHEKTRTWSVERATWVPWRWGDQDSFRDGAMYHAQKLVEQAAESEENIAQARGQAELVLRRAYEMVDWNVAVAWE